MSRNITQIKLIEENSALKDVLGKIFRLISPFIDMNANETFDNGVHQPITSVQRQSASPGELSPDRNESTASQQADFLWQIRLQHVLLEPSQRPAQTRKTETFNSVEPRGIVNNVSSKPRVTIVLDRLNPKDIAKISRPNQQTKQKKQSNKPKKAPQTRSTKATTTSRNRINIKKELKPRQAPTRERIPRKAAPIDFKGQC